jgi:hypothetical protein
MVLGQPKRLIAELFGEDALAHLVDQRLLRRLVHVAERSVVEGNALFVGYDRQARCAVVKDANFQHRCFLLIRPGRARFAFPRLSLRGLASPRHRRGCA